MKHIILSISLLFSVAVFGQQSPVEERDNYGAEVSQQVVQNALSPKALTEKLTEAKKLEHTSVKGTVTSVCPKKGCWLTLDTGSDERLFVKMKDYGFFVPTSLIGREVVLEGAAEIKVIPVEEVRHYAEDAKKSPEEIAAITEPQQEIRFLASGIKVVE